MSDCISWSNIKTRSILQEQHFRSSLWQIIWEQRVAWSWWVLLLKWVIPRVIHAPKTCCWINNRWATFKRRATLFRHSTLHLCSFCRFGCATRTNMLFNYDEHLYTNLKLYNKLSSILKSKIHWFDWWSTFFNTSCIKLWN